MATGDEGDDEDELVEVSEATALFTADGDSNDLNG